MFKNRIHQTLLIACFVGFSWLMMMVVHEAGHVFAAWLTDGEVERVILHPLKLSQTILRVNPNPRLVAWAGPLFGAFAPYAFFLGWRASSKLPWIYLVKFFAGFCFVANGVYLGAGAWANIGDARELRQTGESVWTLAAVALVGLVAGLRLWNGLGPHFGLGEARGEVECSAAYTAAGLLAIVVVIELAASW